MSWFVNDTQKKNIWQDKSINEVIDDYILSPTNMKQNKTKPYQACFLSTDDIVSKEKYKIKGDALTSGEINLRRCLTSD
jgi:hypothetical protein